MIERWKILTDRQKQMVLWVVLDQKKYTAIAGDLNISRTRVVQMFFAIYALLDVRDQIELAFEVGKHWNEIGATMNEKCEITEGK